RLASRQRLARLLMLAPLVLLHSRPSELPAPRPKAASSDSLPKRQVEPGEPGRLPWAGSSSSRASTLPLPLFHTGRTACSEPACTRPWACAPVAAISAVRARASNGERRKDMVFLQTRTGHGSSRAVGTRIV